MEQFISIDDAVRDQGWAVLFVAIYLAISYATGRSMARRGADAAAFGFLVWSAAANVTFALFFWLQLNTGLFAYTAIAIAVALTLLLRRLIGGSADKDAYDPVFFGAIVATAFIAFTAVNVLNGFPASGYNFYQTWNPLYINASFDHGIFKAPQDIGLGEGFLTSGLWYGLDTLGLTALHKSVAGGNAGIGSMAASATASFLTVAVLIQSLRRDPAVMFVFLCAGFVFLRYSPAFNLSLGNDWHDKMIPLASALAITSAVSSAPPRAAMLGGYVAATFMALARNYGAVLAVIYGAAFAVIVWIRQRRLNIWPWIAASGLLLVFIARDLAMLVDKGLFYPRVSALSLHPPSVSKSFWGTLIDWGIWPNGSIFTLANLPIGIVALGALCIGIYVSRRRQASLFPMLVPWLVLLAPLCLEIATGYRKSESFSKLYLGASWFFAWYPCFVVAHLGGGVLVLTRFLAPRHRILAPWFGLALVVFSISALVTVNSVRHGGLGAYWRAATENYLNANTDYLMSERLHALPEAELNELRNRKILYFYYEPGSGLRYFLGGDFFADYDFWSTPVNRIAETATSFEALWIELGCPNIYSGYDALITDYGRWVEYSHWRKFTGDIERLNNYPWVKEVISVPPATFYVTEPSHVTGCK